MKERVEELERKVKQLQKQEIVYSESAKLRRKNEGETVVARELYVMLYQKLRESWGSNPSDGNRKMEATT